MIRLRDRGSGRYFCGARVRPPLTGEDPQLVPTGVINWVAAVESYSACSAVPFYINFQLGLWACLVELCSQQEWSVRRW